MKMSADHRNATFAALADRLDTISTFAARRSCSTRGRKHATRRPKPSYGA
jgi:hypothetical protein